MKRRHFLRGCLMGVSLLAAGPAMSRLALVDDPLSINKGMSFSFDLGTVDRCCVAHIDEDNVIQWIQEIGTMLIEQNRLPRERLIHVPAPAVRWIEGRPTLSDRVSAWWLRLKHGDIDE